MNYWIVSQNVMGGRDEQAWEKAILDNNRAFVGRNADDGNGEIFANSINIGDLVLIAKASNANKKVLLSGIVESKAQTEHLPGTPDVAQNIKLRYVLTKEDIDKLNLIFDSTCAFGDSARPTAVFAMKTSNSGDKKNIKKLLTGIKNKKAIIEMQEKIKALKYKYQIILQGPPGTGKTRLAKDIAYSMIFNDSVSMEAEERRSQLKNLENSDQFELIQFHPAYSYEDFIRGITAKTNGSNIEYVTENKVLAQFAKKALNNPERNYILIIDEINRANLPAVLGELIYALEYRDSPVKSMYAEGADNNRGITLSKNLFIIGTMNTADRSVGHIDYAIRRRFAFIEVLADKSVIENEKGRKLFDCVSELFNKKSDDGFSSLYLASDFKAKDVQLGHSYFLGSDEDLKLKLDYEIKPILQEYLKDGILLENAEKIINNLHAKVFISGF